ncbi:MAG: hypothetical protein ABWY68_04070 [Cryobacterium sp.]
MAAPEERPSLPGSVTFSVVLMYLGGIVQMGLGIIIVFLRYVPGVTDHDITLAVTLVGVGIILFGLFVVSLASGVARGSRASRLSATIVLLLGWVLFIVDLVVSADGDWSGVIIQTAIAVAVILPLWVGAGRRYFAAT